MPRPTDAAPTAVASSRPPLLTRFHERILFEQLHLKAADGAVRLATALSEAKVDLNPHQVEAAAFALESIPRGGCVLADEVGLGKTIEAGLVMAQLLAEGRTRLLVLCPATLRAQWQAELKDKFDLSSTIVDGRHAAQGRNAFDCKGPVICSHPFAAARPAELSGMKWDLVIIDEAHRLRNAYKASHKTGRALRSGLKGVPKLLLTATPLQNDLWELFGLLSLVDEQLLGPEHAFRERYAVDPVEGALAEESARDLKDRLAGSVQRTLRRQVREYVRFTERRSLVEDFAPSPEEQRLYDHVSGYLRRSEAAGLDPGRRTLLTLVYRKLLASSSYAIAPTLQKLAETLQRRVEALRRQAAPPSAFEPDEALHFVEEAEEWTDNPASGPVSLKAMQAEVSELQRYADLAAGIRVNAKGEALKRALDRTFTVAKAHQWPQKAVIFTESKRTQAYLFRLLSDHGYAGRISLLSGDAGTPEERQALVAEFRDRTEILLSTEAGAEGLNLQFCNVVVNYDLPWNPQRIEQRIGRCHRYGQTRDVLVLNFVNRKNAADARLYELLEKKLNLFDGVFGASDEILGALQSGVDFERRVLDIYQSCREPEQIDRAFDELRADLETRIDARMTQARTIILERFDTDVRRRLKLAGQNASALVQQRRQQASALTASMFPEGAPLDAARSREGLQRALAHARGAPADAVSYLALDGSALPPRLASLGGAEGWWFAYRFEVSGLRAEEALVHTVLVHRDGAFHALPIEDAELLMRVPATDERQRTPPPISVTGAQAQALDAIGQQLQRSAERRSALDLDLAKERKDRYAEDCLLEPRQAVEKALDAWSAARSSLAEVADLEARSQPRALVERLERDYRKKLSALRSEEDARYAEKDRALAQMAQKAAVKVRRSLIASAYFWVC